MMSNLSSGTWIRLIIWLAIGLIIYFSYSIRHSQLKERNLLQSTHIPLQEIDGSDIDLHNKLSSGQHKIKFTDEDLEEISLT